MSNTNQKSIPWALPLDLIKYLLVSIVTASSPVTSKRCCMWRNHASRCEKNHLHLSLLHSSGLSWFKLGLEFTMVSKSKHGSKLPFSSCMAGLPQPARKDAPKVQEELFLLQALPDWKNTKMDLTIKIHRSFEGKAEKTQQQMLELLFVQLKNDKTPFKKWVSYPVQARSIDKATSRGSFRRIRSNGGASNWVLAWLCRKPRKLMSGLALEISTQSFQISFRLYRIWMIFNGSVSPNQILQSHSWLRLPFLSIEDHARRLWKRSLHSRSRHEEIPNKSFVTMFERKKANVAKRSSCLLWLKQRKPQTTKKMWRGANYIWKSTEKFWRGTIQRQ